MTEGTLTIQRYTNAPEIVKRFIMEDDVMPESKRSHFYNLAVFFTFLHEIGKTYDTATTADIIQYKQQVIDKGVSASTQRSYIGTVKKFYQWCNGHSYCMNTAMGVKLPKKSNKYIKQHLTREEGERLLETVKDNPRTYALINILCRTGLRQISISRAKISDIQYVRGKVLLYHQGKGRTEKKHYVVLSPKAYQAYKDYLQKCRPFAGEDEPLFTSDSDRSKGKPLSTRSIRQIIKEALRESGIDSELYSTHSLRHSFAIWALEEGASIYDIQIALDHASPTTTERYLESQKDDYRLANPTEFLIDNVI